MVSLFREIKTEEQYVTTFMNQRIAAFSIIGVMLLVFFAMPVVRLPVWACLAVGLAGFVLAAVVMSVGNKRMQEFEETGSTKSSRDMVQELAPHNTKLQRILFGTSEVPES